MNEPDLVRAMLQARTIAVIGLSTDLAKPSHYVSAYMQQHGHRIYPVNPSIAEALGEKAYPTLADLPVKPDLVNVFRLSKFISGIVDEMLQLGLTRLWVQKGIVNLEAATRAQAAGISVVMDRCLMIEHRSLTSS
jgi:uncharacterized protein